MNDGQHIFIYGRRVGGLGFNQFHGPFPMKSNHGFRSLLWSYATLSRPFLELMNIINELPLHMG